MKQKKSLGQVFLKEDWACRNMSRIMESWGAQSVLEIGPGEGVLTHVLLENSMDVKCIEKDDRFAAKLQEFAQSRLVEKPSLNVDNIDVLKFSLEEWVRSNKDPKVICGNIPYNISSPILAWCLPFISEVKGAMFMVQKEFGLRVCGKAGTKTYGSLSVFAQLRADCKVEFDVGREHFKPIPKVDSVVISLRAKENEHSAEDLKITEKLTRHAFTQRRKKLRNSIAPFLEGISEDELSVDFNRRPDSLSPEEYLALAKKINSLRQGE